MSSAFGVVRMMFEVSTISEAKFDTGMEPDMFADVVTVASGMFGADIGSETTLDKVLKRLVSRVAASGTSAA